MPERTCKLCDEPFTGSPQRLYCSDGCILEARRKTARNYQAKNYKKRLNAPIPCKVCNEYFTPKKSDATMCSDLCRHKHQSEMRSQRCQANRKCVRCGTDEGLSGTGKPVCANCKIDKRDPQKSKHKETQRKYRKYGITEEQYLRMLDEQDFRCLICKTDDPGGKGWCIDHCHSTKRVRGILCMYCNTGIGLFRDDPALLEAAIKYLRVHLSSTFGS